MSARGPLGAQRAALALLATPSAVLLASLAWVAATHHVRGADWFIIAVFGAGALASVAWCASVGRAARDAAQREAVLLLGSSALAVASWWIAASVLGTHYPADRGYGFGYRMADLSLPSPWLGVLMMVASVGALALCLRHNHRMLQHHRERAARRVLLAGLTGVFLGFISVELLPIDAYQDDSNVNQLVRPLTFAYIDAKIVVLSGASRVPETPRQHETPAGAMIHIPEGRAAIGRPGAPPPADLRGVRLDAFWIDALPVTRAHYKKCVSARACAPIAAWADEDVMIHKSRDPRSRYGHTREPLPGDFDLLPATRTTQAQAAAFCAWAGKRLPKLDEWAKAAFGPRSAWRVRAPIHAVSVDHALYQQDRSPYGVLGMLTRTNRAGGERVEVMQTPDGYVGLSTFAASSQQSAPPSFHITFRCVADTLPNVSKK